MAFLGGWEQWEQQSILSFLETFGSILVWATVQFYTSDQTLQECAVLRFTTPTQIEPTPADLGRCCHFNQSLQLSRNFRPNLLHCCNLTYIFCWYVSNLNLHKDRMLCGAARSDQRRCESVRWEHVLCPHHLEQILKSGGKGRVGGMQAVHCSRV